MHIWKWLRQHYNVWVFLGAILVVVLLLIILGGTLWFFRPAKEPQGVSTAVLTLIQAPSETPTIPVAVNSTEPATTNSNDQEGMKIGVTVQISGTGSAGLRMRSGPGTNSTIQFVALENEPYQVLDGPQESDGYIWWYLVSPYDASRSGWAASEYLIVFTDVE